MTTVSVNTYADFPLLTEKFKCDRTVFWNVDAGNAFVVAGFNDSFSSAISFGQSGGKPAAFDADFPHAIETSAPFSVH